MLKKHMAACLFATALAAPVLAQSTTAPQSTSPLSTPSADRPAASGSGSTTSGSPAMVPGGDASSTSGSPGSGGLSSTSGGNPGAGAPGATATSSGSGSPGGSGSAGAGTMSSGSGSPSGSGSASSGGTSGSGASGSGSATSSTAQTGGASAQGNFVTQLQPGQWRASKLIGTRVVSANNETIGDVNDVVFDRNGTAVAVVVGVGGFLGIGEKNVAVPYDMLVWNTGGSRATSPSAATVPGSAPGGASAPPPRPERMPGADVADQVLNAVPENRSGTVDPGTGRSMPETQAPATVPVGSDRGPVRAEIRLTKADLQNAPEFRYDRDGANTPRR